MILQFVLSLSTALFTLGAGFFFVKAKHKRDEAFSEVDTVRHQIKKFDLLEEELAALAKRFSKLSGRFYRLRSADADGDGGATPESAERTPEQEERLRHYNPGTLAGIDPELEDLIRFQRADPVQPPK